MRRSASAGAKPCAKRAARRTPPATRCSKCAGWSSFSRTSSGSRLKARRSRSGWASHRRE
eukprot:scaffold46069_cov31-Tisochrysis_lutea.AAC.2